jgi:hypothetical protein
VGSPGEGGDDEDDVGPAPGVSPPAAPFSSLEPPQESPKTTNAAMANESKKRRRDRATIATNLPDAMEMK